MPRFRSTGYWEDRDIASGKILSGETFTCAHCGSLVELAVREAPAMCHAEWLPVCPPCHAKGTCVPREKALETFEGRMKEAERRGLFFRELGIEK